MGTSSGQQRPTPGCFTWLFVIGCVMIGALTGDGASFFVWGLIAVGVYLLGRQIAAESARRGASNLPPRKSYYTPPHRRPPKTPARQKRGADYTPTPPEGQPVEPWGKPERSYEIVGEFYRQTSFEKLFAGTPYKGAEGAVLNLPAVLGDDSANPHDRHAVAIWVGGHHVGYLAREDAAKWSRHVKTLSAQGKILQLPARVWAAKRGSEIKARVTLRLCKRSEIMPANSFPEDPHVVLPAGASIQVTKEDQHMDVLTPLTALKSASFAATLHAIYEIRPRSAVELVEVRIGGERVGVLSPGQSENMLPLVKFFEARNLTPVVRATVAGNSLKADVVLRVIRSQDADPRWLESFGHEVASERVDVSVLPEPEWDD